MTYSKLRLATNQEKISMLAPVPAPHCGCAKKCLKVCRKIPLPECFMELHSTIYGAVCMLEFVINQACHRPLKSASALSSHTKQINVPYYQGRETTITEGQHNQSIRQKGCHAQQGIDWLLWRQLPSQSKYLRHHFTRSDQ